MQNLASAGFGFPENKASRSQVLPITTGESGVFCAKGPSQDPLLGFSLSLRTKAEPDDGRFPKYDDCCRPLLQHDSQAAAAEPKDAWSRTSYCFKSRCEQEPPWFLSLQGLLLFANTDP